MIPHSRSFSADMQTKSTHLAATVAAAFSPAQISAACTAVECYLSTHTPDQLRWFFSITFPTLICRVFGFDDASPSPAQMSRSVNGWIDIAVAENEAELAGKIFSLLSPNGVLLSSIHVVDRLSLVKYVFPVERLPMWIQYVLQNVRDYSTIVDLCPLLYNRLMQNISKGYSYQVHLNLFEYYLFWFAYYPVCRGSSEGSESVKVQRPKKFKLENWTNSFPSLSSTKRGTEKKTETNFYVKLLYAYLHSFVVINTESVQRPYNNSLLQYYSGNDNSTEQAAFVVHTFMNFWLLDNDFSPLPEGVCKSLGARSPVMSALCETPPTSRLADVASVFVQCLNLASIPAMADSHQLDHVGNLGWRVSGSFDIFKSSSAIPSVHSVGSSISLIRRPLYRFILRTFLFSPAESSILNASQTFTLWVNYMEPWSNKFEEFSDLDELVGLPNRNSAKDIRKSSPPQYSSMWQGYILTNYLFYSSLIMHFIGFAHKFLHIDTDVVIQMVVKVMNILTCSSELRDLIKSIDAVYHSKSAGLPKSVLTTLNSFVPTIRRELQDWEYGLCESDADGSFLRENWNTDLQLFADGEDGGRHLFQLFLLRAETELQSTSGSNAAQKLQCLDSLKTQLNQLFGIPVTNLSPDTLGSKHCHKSCQDVFKPRGVGNQMAVEIKYRGDTMKRPFSDDEITWLAKLLVKLSCWVNESLGLNQVNCTHQTHGQSYVEVPSGLRTVHGSSETLKIVMQSLLYWFMWFCGAGVQYMRNHGLRVNLRMLASKKIIVLVLVVCAYGVLKNCLCIPG